MRSSYRDAPGNSTLMLTPGPASVKTGFKHGKPALGFGMETSSWYVPGGTVAPGVLDGRRTIPGLTDIEYVQLLAVVDVERRNPGRRSL